MDRPRTVITTLSDRAPSWSRPLDAETLARGLMVERPSPVCFPRDDPQFAERVQSLLDHSLTKGALAAAIQALLREEYPLAVISPRHDLAAVDGRRVWYVFRQGSVVAPADGGTP